MDEAFEGRYRGYKDDYWQLPDLHLHVGSAVAPHILWEIARSQGFVLPAKTYWEFVDLITVHPEQIHNLREYLQLFHWTEKIQSSPEAIERSVYAIVAKEFRSSHVALIELRYNPMKRNQGGERDLDHIFHAAYRGMERATLEYGARAGLLVCLAKEFSYDLNEILIRKAIKHRGHGVVGIDIAGAEGLGFDSRENLEAYRPLIELARDAGLKITVHVGETPESGARGVRDVLEVFRPHRIGHGIQAADDPEVMSMLRESGVVLELCPVSNLKTRAVSGIEELKTRVRTLLDHGVELTLNTDGPYMLKTNMIKEIALVLEYGIMSKEEVTRCIATAHRATFVPES